ncbi:MULTISPECIES: DDE-type integrase/transposase/recombinase [unclassified Mesorhizobium]|uniref:DDE-type integrase/transposase/recombinase n=1 Tax=unclassified Mesorhizobium TaxID=325217 RepID=UPI00112E79D4|nr:MULTISPECIES: DDE-type integrase/transposase/recombinase [unclassified Mesorhizobium]MBZ9696459.1 DDE-type integrase/transposase/recombinase [Mesorhizobium sp. CO1-1-9]TPK11619.1 transposase family protein [Mesorhizobium sp. B2-5-7]
MDAGLDIHPGELYIFPQRSSKAIYEYLGVEDDERLLFVCKSGTSTFRPDRDQFLELRNRPGGAVRVRTSAPDQADGFVYTDPATFLDPDADGFSSRERQRIRTLKKDRLWALTVQFFTIKFDDTPGVGLTEARLAKFIGEHASEAESVGLKRSISASTLRRAIHDCGASGDRGLHHFLPDKERERGPFWDPFILQLKAELIDEFWSPDQPRLTEVQEAFRLKLREKNEALRRLDADLLTQPTGEIMRLWIKGAECYYRYKARYGVRAAGRRYRGQNRAIQARRPLEYVMFDHTRVDAWANVEHENGKTILQERPWLMLVVDVFSQVILAAILTYEPPSIYTVVMGLKQMVRPKDFLPPELLRFKNFGDFWGKPSFVIVDRAWENTGTAFQTMCESVGIRIIWAPVRTPEFKCHAEHGFHLLNSIYWHRLPSGIPHKPHVMKQLGLDPQKKADRNIQQMNDGLWYAIRKHAFRVNDGLGMAPARAWQEGFRNHNRPMMDDVTAFDTFLGKVCQCQLSTSGVKLDHQRFHDPKITSALLNDLLRYAKASKQRRAPNSSGTVSVHATMDWTCESIHVWNPKARRNIKLPNILSRFSAGLSWEDAKACREFAQKENLSFCTEDEMLEVSAALMATYKTQVKDQPFREARKAARRYRPRPQLVRGSTIEEAWEEPSATGMGGTSISHTLPAAERMDGRKVIKSARRGGKKASEKAAKARKAKKEQKSQASNFPEPPRPKPANKQEPAVWASIDDSAARLKRLAEALGVAQC